MHPCLIAVFAAAALFVCAPPALAGGDKEHSYVGNKKCGTCHKKDDIGNQIAAWKDSGHAKAWETLATDQAKEWAAERALGDPQQEADCVKCHETAHGVPDERVSRKFDRQGGVQCEACHGAGKDYRKKKIMVDRDEAVSRGLVLQNEEVCLTCHNDESPAWKADRYTRADGTKAGFDYEQAVKKIAHPVPEDYDPSADDPE
ncbi:MAG: hypothetical protein JRG82_03195 [Deltaproteobacteria bacterium]|nr:hypothetical protein [Deltaproteobacteria bacterium]